ncbi:hypothetical protein SAMN06265360_11585 [Haloechinothrix alba]|uniref:Proteins of 100 residues with WXG n=1 Tax=Haloechinothrix alba TaxID=664784 RepID=A0A238YHU8_9PSEU|nr:hypothetical protein [Haloechinothrix alba]SNR70707.1 hypothetical protein SAMN06265360_11585 [Haloechinothrix alba]
MADVEDVASDIDIESDDSPAIDVAGGIGEVPVAGSAVGLAGDTFGAGQSVAGLLNGGENEPGVGEVALEAGDVLTDAGSFVAECSDTVTSMVTNPAGWLAGNGLDFLLELITPLQDALDTVTGDAPALETAAGNFVSIGEGLQQMSENFVEVADTSLAGWNGEAADAARDQLADFADGISGIAAHSGHVAEMLEASAMVMEAVEEAVKSLISDFVGWLIMTWVPALASSVASLGSSIAAAQAVTATRAAITSSRVGRTVQRLVDLLRKVSAFFDKIKRLLGTGGGMLGKALGGNAGSSVGSSVGEAVFAGGSAYVQQRTGFDPGAAPLEMAPSFADHHVAQAQDGSPDIPEEQPSHTGTRQNLDV